MDGLGQVDALGQRINLIFLLGKKNLLRRPMDLPRIHGELCDLFPQEEPDYIYALILSKSEGIVGNDEEALKDMVIGMMFKTPCDDYSASVIDDDEKDNDAFPWADWTDHCHDPEDFFTYDLDEEEEDDGLEMMNVMEPALNVWEATDGDLASKLKAVPDRNKCNNGHSYATSGKCMAERTTRTDVEEPEDLLPFVLSHFKAPPDDSRPTEAVDWRRKAHELMPQRNQLLQMASEAYAKYKNTPSRSIAGIYSEKARAVSQQIVAMHSVAAFLALQANNTCILDAVDFHGLYVSEVLLVLYPLLLKYAKLVQVG